MVRSSLRLDSADGSIWSPPPRGEASVSRPARCPYGTFASDGREARKRRRRPTRETAADDRAWAPGQRGGWSREPPLNGPIPGRALSSHAREEDVALPAVEGGDDGNSGRDSGEHEDGAGIADPGDEDGETRRRQAIGRPLEILVEHEECQRDRHDHRPEADGMDGEVSCAPVADGQLATLDGASQARQRSQATQRQEHQAGRQNANRNHGYRPHRSVAGALEDGPG